MKTVRELAAEIVAREGGYVDDPSDPGGATKHGVTIGTMRRLGLDLTGDGKVDAEDVRRLTPDRAEAIFIEHYFDRPGIEIGNLPVNPLRPNRAYPAARCRLDISPYATTYVL